MLWWVHGVVIPNYRNKQNLGIVKHIHPKTMKLKKVIPQEVNLKARKA